MSSSNENSTNDNNFGNDSPPPVTEQTVKRLILDEKDIDSLTRIANKICDYVIEMFMSSDVEDYIKAYAPIIVNCYRAEFLQVLNNGLTIVDIINFSCNVKGRMYEQNIDDISSETFNTSLVDMVFPKFQSQYTTFLRKLLEDFATVLNYGEENVDRTIHLFGKIRGFIEQLEFNDNDISVVLGRTERCLTSRNSRDYLSVIVNMLFTDT